MEDSHVDFTQFIGTPFFPHTVTHNDIISPDNIQTLKAIYDKGISVFGEHTIFVQRLQSSLLDVLDQTPTLSEAGKQVLQQLHQSGDTYMIDILNHNEDTLHYRNALYIILSSLDNHKK